MLALLKISDITDWEVWCAYSSQRTTEYVFSKFFLLYLHCHILYTVFCLIHCDKLSCNLPHSYSYNYCCQRDVL